MQPPSTSVATHNCNFRAPTGLYEQRWNLPSAIFVLLAILQTAATYQVEAIARISSERALGQTEPYPNLTLMRGHPYAWLIADLDGTWEHGAAHLQVNTGRLYPKAPVPDAGVLDYRNLYFLPQAYGSITWATGSLDFGRQRIVAAAGRIADADVPAAHWSGTWGTWRARAAVAKLETTDWLDTNRWSSWAQVVLERRIGWWTLRAGSHAFWDRDGRLADLYNPLWPLVAATAACSDQRGRCYLLLADAGGFLQGGKTRLSSSWLGLEGYAGPLALEAQVVLQVGRSSLEPLASVFTGAEALNLQHRAWAVDAKATWVSTRHEVGLSLLALSGNDSLPMRSLGAAARTGSGTVNAFVGIGSFWTDTFLLFGGGLSGDFATGELQPAGRLGFGVVGLVPSYHFYGDKLWALLQIAPLWALHTVPLVPNAINDWSQARRYGVEVDARLTFLPTHWLTLVLESAVLTAAQFPVLTSGDAGFPRLTAPQSAGYVALTLQFAWENVWTKTP